MRTILTLLVAGLFTASGAGQAPRRPEGPAPNLQIVTFKDGHIAWEIIVTEYKTEQREVERKGPDGKITKQRITVPVPVTVKKLIQYDVKKTKVTSIDGKAVAVDALPKLLKDPTAVLILFDDKPLDPFYRDFFKEDVLVVVPPKPEPPQGDGPAIRPNEEK